MKTLTEMSFMKLYNHRPEDYNPGFQNRKGCGCQLAEGINIKQLEYVEPSEQSKHHLEIITVPRR